MNSRHRAAWMIIGSIKFSLVSRIYRLGLSQQEEHRARRVCTGPSLASALLPCASATTGQQAPLPAVTASERRRNSAGDSDGPSLRYTDGETAHSLLLPQCALRPVRVPGPRAGPRPSSVF